ncbi:MAG: hypothetical protein ABIP75_08070 [Pyrinomonadaceae bacterium]
MENRFRMVIPLDGAVPESLSAPHFDQAASSARPVRPLTEGEETVVHQRLVNQGAAPVYQPQYAPAPPVVNYVPQYPMPVVAPIRRSKGWGVLIALVVIIAAGLGVAGGYGIANYSSLTKSEPIAAAVALRQRNDQPDPAFTMPPEEIPEDPVELDPDAQVTDPGDGPVLVPGQVPPGRDPEIDDPQLPPVKNPGTVQNDNSGEGRPRRAPNSSDPKNTAKRGNKNSNTSSSPGPIRRTGGEILTRIREIFEGKPQ